MNDDERNLAGLSPAEKMLASRLARLGPVMEEQVRAESEMDPEFVRDLRRRLIYDDQPASRTVLPRASRRRIVAIGATATGLVALLAAVLLALLLPGQVSTPRFSAPYPRRSDLTYSFPAPSVAVRRLGPTVSLVHPRAGSSYPGHLRLVAGRLPQATAPLHAYRLAGASNVVALGRRLLGIQALPRRLIIGAAAWQIAADGGFPSHEPLHSLAVSLVTGELIYHDRRNFRLARAGEKLSRVRAIVIARRWLSRLGWPGNAMPVNAVATVTTLPKVQQVTFGWIGVGPAATPAATLWVTPDGSVIEAWVWPPVVRGGLIPARSASAAWLDVRAGRLPVAVEGFPARSATPGAGSLEKTGVVKIIVTRHGRSYLVPTYRFEGHVRLRGQHHTYVWYSLAPGARK